MAVLLALYALLNLLSRTPFVRHKVEDALSSVTGIPMEVRRVRATASLGLKIHGIIGADGEAAVSADTLLLSWRPFPWRVHDITLDTPRISFGPRADGVIAPFPDLDSRHFFPQIGLNVAAWNPPPDGGGGEQNNADAMENSEKSTQNPPWWSHFKCRQGTLRWVDADGGVAAEASGVQLLLDAMRTRPGPTVIHADIQIARLNLAGKNRLTDGHLVLVCTAQRAFLVSLTAAAWGPSAPPAPASRAAKTLELLQAL